MTRLRLRYLWIALLLCAGCAFAQGADRETLYQVSTIDALLAGLYDGVASVRTLLAHGDFGLGTFDALDGEMIVLDGRCHQVTSDGVAHRVTPSRRTPFAAVTFFDRDLTADLKPCPDLKGLLAQLDALVPSQNLFTAIRVDGVFDLVKARSVPRQHRPYPLLTAVVAHQPVFEFKQVRGTLVGFRCPYFVQGVNVPGYHLHFLTEDRKHGGHVLDLSLREGTAALDLTPNLDLRLPTEGEFLHKDFRPKEAGALERVEK
jgi:acetolactate decarboxylase